MSATARRIGRVRGVVQGVGFRPFVARLGRALSLAGVVRNDGAAVVLDVEGSPSALDELARRLLTEAPPAARIEEVRWREAAPAGRAELVIEASRDATPGAVPIPPDLASCAACLEEVRDPSMRRHRYPFTNCTACGPRFTIVTALPYDRPRTTMAAFALCDGCAREYGDPNDRRYHAQPIACPACGPKLRLLDREGAPLAETEAALEHAAIAIERGAIVALKGLGGVQLLADARDAGVVRRLRARKHREAQPFAVMVADLGAARRLARLTPEDEAALASAAAPIVLVRRRAGAAIADEVAPRAGALGLMLPSTPLHHLLTARVPFPLVCTSGNLHDEPIAIDEADALARLGAVADVFLMHDRPIARRVDDGVVHVVDGRPRVLRLGRGLGPISLALAGDDRPRLCVGAHLKSAPAALVDGHAVLWPHVGDLETPLAREGFRAAIDDLMRFLRLEPAEVVCDAHPDYASTIWAERSGYAVRRVPHHLAHVAACMAEHGLDEALGFAWDGVGLGSDGGLWGGEAFAVGPRSRRRAHLLAFPLPGGDAASRDGRRALAGLAFAAGRPELADPRLVASARSPRTPTTSSVGRLFDAVAALLGVATRSTYEGQAAMELEALAEPGHPPYPSRVVEGVFDWRPMIDPLLADRADPARAASRFHATLAWWIVELARLEGASRVVLSGGCFQNRLLSEHAIASLRERGVDVRLPERTPPNDGGVALGQAWLASRPRVT